MRVCFYASICVCRFHHLNIIYIYPCTFWLSVGKFMVCRLFIVIIIMCDPSVLCSYLSHGMCCKSCCHDFYVDIKTVYYVKYRSALWWVVQPVGRLLVCGHWFNPLTCYHWPLPVIPLHLDQSSQGQHRADPVSLSSRTVFNRSCQHFMWHEAFG